MRENIPTARLEDTPTPEQDLSTIPERAALPQVVDVIPGPQLWHLTLELEGGEQVHISPELVKWAGLQPGRHGSTPMVIVGWPDRDTTLYAVPAGLVPELLLYFPDPEGEA